MSFEVGDEVVVLDGELKGFYGVVAGYEEMFEVYLVELPELSKDHYFGFKDTEMAKLDPAEDEVVPPFGMSSAELAAYAGNFLENTLDRIVRDENDAQKGFQDFEGLDTGELLDRILEKIEDVAGYSAKLHILVRRIQTAMEGK